MDRLISKEEIERLENIVYRYNRESRGWHDCNDIRLNSNDIKAIEKAIELIKGIPSAEPIYYPPCEDCHKKMNEIRKAYDEIQSAEPKVGHWIDADGDNAICGCCNRLNHLYGTYCKHCGARMVELQEGSE